jgi:hypothetical protein
MTVDFRVPGDLTVDGESPGGGGDSQFAPAVETVVGMWGLRTVYRQHFAGTTPGDGVTHKITSSNDIDAIVNVRGFITAIDGNKFPPSTWHIIDTARFIIVVIGGTGTNDIQIETHGGSFAANPYEISVDYVKLP